MRAGFLGQSICSLGFGIATLQAPRLVMDQPTDDPLTPPGEKAHREDEKGAAVPSTAAVTISPRLWA